MKTKENSFALGRLIVPSLFAFFICFAWFAPTSPLVDQSSAQVVEKDKQKNLEWDRSISDEKLVRLRDENRQVEQTIKAVVATNFPRLKFQSSYLGDPDNGGVGRKGQSSCHIKWKNKSSEYSIRITFMFGNSDAVKNHLSGVDSISMGELYPAPDFLGKPSVSVKNISYNKSMTNVGIHFVKGRLEISAYLRNHKKTALENEKDLIEFVRKIYQVINAKQTIQEV